MSKITVVLPIYNVEKYLRKCLDSLIEQTFSDFIVYAISDGSPDNSESIVLEYTKKDNRIEYFLKENGGYGSVLEYAIKMCKTEYLLVCDPDDWLEKDCLEKLYSVAKKDNVDLVIGEKYFVYNDSYVKKFERMKPNYFNLKSNFKYTIDLTKMTFLSPSPHSKLYKTSLLKNISFPHKVSYTDFILYFVAVKNSKSIEYYDIPLSNYLVDRPGNSMTCKKPKMVSDLIIVWNSAYNQCNHNDYYSIMRLYDYFRMILNYYKKNSESLYNDNLYEELCKIRKILRKKYRNIKNIFNLNFRDKIKMFILLNTHISLKVYIKLK